MSIAVKPDWRYRLLSHALMPVLFLHTLVQARRAGDRYMPAQKLGRGLPALKDRPVWVHMASVGEVNAAVPLIRELQARYPELPIVVSTFTPTGARTARDRFGPGIPHVYLPLDFGQGMRLFLRRLQPRCALILETEIWPRLYYHCKRNRVPLVMVNARLSDRITGAPSWFRACYEKALKNVERVLARSETDAGRFVGLGMPARKVEVIGNIKFAASEGRAPVEPVTLARPYVLAASTHNDEELQLVRAWLASPLRREYLLVVAPRHPRRKSAILQQLRPLKARVAVRSDGAAVDESTEVYLADTFGELRRFIAGARLVFMGGSLVPIGGHNLLEVACLGRVALCGPHMDNFADERDLLVEGGAAVVAQGAEDMVTRAAALLSAPERLKAMGECAAQLVSSRSDMAQRYVDALSPYLS